jgi:hypothetical protein
MALLDLLGADREIRRHADVVRILPTTDADPA